MQINNVLSQTVYEVVLWTKCKMSPAGKTIELGLSISGKAATGENDEAERLCC